MSGKVAIECPVDYQYEEVTVDYQYEEVDYQYEDYYGYGDGVPDPVDSSLKGSGSNGKDNPPQELDYGYGSTEKEAQAAAVDAADLYGYGETEEQASSAETPPRAARQQTRRRNSCVIRRDQEKGSLAVAEFLMGGPPRMSDKDLAVEHFELGSITT